MEFWVLELGQDPWPRLAEESLAGTLRCDDGAPREVSVSIRGAHSRKFPKRSLQITFPSDRLPDEPPTSHTIRRIHLNADYIDPTLMRSALSYSLFPTIGVDAPKWRHVALTVSGQFAGIYVGLESVDRDFCLRRGWSPGPIFYAINRNANFGLLNPFTKGLKEPLDRGYLPVEHADPEPIRQMLLAINLGSGRSFAKVAARWFDLDRYLSWLIGAVFVGNRDGFMHNYALYFEPDQHRFRIIPWDYDATWGIDIHGRPARLDRVPLTGWNKLTHRLLSTPNIRERYRSLFEAALDGPLSPGAVHSLIDRIGRTLSPWIVRDPYCQQNLPFSTEVQKLRHWAVDRRNLLLTQLERF